ncbi:MAG: 2-polyprenyl-3-methyl-6-methoxy-1,4-benzoquinone monooxygenase [Gammaproteobacteria bacterium]
MTPRKLTPLDHVISGLDQVARSLVGGAATARRGNPAEGINDMEMSDAERRHAAGLMRINHTGEICAQALYQSQAITARDAAVRSAMEEAAREEVDHLAWCEQRLNELDSHRSLLNPLWYVGSLALGATAGIAGDRWNLGFLAETERQVVRHLDSHLEQLPASDERSRAIVAQMKTDEGEHASKAVEQGAAELPTPIKGLMTLSSKLMTHTVYRL